MQAHYRHYREVIRELTMMSDALMRNVLKEPACTEYMLQVILEKEIKITDVVIQEDHKNLRGRSAILDCVAEDENGRRYNLEVQQERSGAAPRRARYHSGILDANTLNPGEGYDQLPETCIIFITHEGRHEGTCLSHREKNRRDKRSFWRSGTYPVCECQYTRTIPGWDS